MHQHETGVPRLLLIDAITLVAAAALMLSPHRAIRRSWAWGDPIASCGPRQTRAMAWAPALPGSSLILLVSLLAHPGGPRRLQRGAPGLLVHVAVAAVLAVRVAGWVAQASIRHACRAGAAFSVMGPAVEVMTCLRDGIRRDVAVAVTATWITPAIVSRRHPERAWDDRPGRSPGVVCLLLYRCAPLHILLP